MSSTAVETTTTQLLRTSVFFDTLAPTSSVPASTAAAARTTTTTSVAPSTAAPTPQPTPNAVPLTPEQFAARDPFTLDEAQKRLASNVEIGVKCRPSLQNCQEAEYAVKWGGIIASSCPPDARQCPAEMEGADAFLSLRRSERRCLLDPCLPSFVRCVWPVNRGRVAVAACLNHRRFCMQLQAWLDDVVSDKIGNRTVALYANWPADASVLNECKVFETKTTFLLFFLQCTFLIVVCAAHLAANASRRCCSCGR